MPRTRHGGVVRNVSAHDVSQRTYRKRIPAGDTGARPRLMRKVMEERERGQADLPKFIDVSRPGDGVSLGGAYGNVLFKAGQWTVKPAGKPQRARHKDTLSIVHVVP